MTVHPPQGGPFGPGSWLSPDPPRRTRNTMSGDQRATQASPQPVKPARTKEAPARAGGVPAVDMVSLSPVDAQTLQRLAGNGALAQLLADRPSPTPPPPKDAGGGGDVVHVQRHASFEH